MQKIRSGRADQDLSATQRFLMERVRLTPLTFLETDPEKCVNRPIVPDVRVTSIGDAVTLRCGAENLPLGALLIALSHELGHMVDPCIMHMDSDGRGGFPLKGAAASLSPPSTLDLRDHPYYNNLDCVSQRYTNAPYPSYLSAQQLSGFPSSPQCRGGTKEHFADECGADLFANHIQAHPLSENDSLSLMWWGIEKCVVATTCL